MSNSNQTPPPNNIIPFPLTGSKVVRPASREIPEELAKLDGKPIASIPADNKIIDVEAKVIPGKETANNVEFHLHEDGSVMQYMERPGYAPQCLLLDGAGRQYGVARNHEVAEMICNGVNFLHLAKTTLAAEQQAKREKENPGGPPPALLLPPGFSNPPDVNPDS